MITKDQAIALSEKYNTARHPKEDYKPEWLCETKNTFYIGYYDWGFHMNSVDKETGKVTSDDSRLHINDSEFWNSPLIKF